MGTLSGSVRSLLGTPTRAGGDVRPAPVPQAIGRSRQGPALGLPATTKLVTVAVTAEERNGDLALQFHVVVLGVCPLHV